MWEQAKQDATKELSDPNCANFLVEIFAWAIINQKGWTSNMSFTGLKASINGHKAKLGVLPSGLPDNTIASTPK